MPSLTINLPEVTYNRLVSYARDEAGTLTEVAASEIIEEYLAEDFERDTQTGELLYDRDDGHQHNPDWLNQMLPAWMIERDYDKQPGTVRSYLRYHPELKDTDDFRKDGHGWLVRREAAERIWGNNSE